MPSKKSVLPEAGAPMNIELYDSDEYSVSYHNIPNLYNWYRCIIRLYVRHSLYS
jgi:hypothetical protein